MNAVLIVGAGGHAKVVIDIIEKARLYEIAFLVDDNPLLKGRVIYGYRVIGGRDDLSADGARAAVQKAVVAIGDNAARIWIAQWLLERGFELIAAVHPSAQIARGVKLGANTVVMAGSIINSDAEIGQSVIINTASGIDHDCIIGNGTHIAPGCRLCGSVIVGDHVLIGAGTTIVRGVTIGAGTIIGAGSVVADDIPANVVALGNPARPIKTNSNGLR